jgi:hypothetical protein
MDGTLALDLMNIEAPLRENGLQEPDYEGFDWAAAMDRTRSKERNDTPVRGRRARIYMHYVLSPDRRDHVSLGELHQLSTSWARLEFPDFEVAIIYHDDNEGHIPHAHVIVNNTNLLTEGRLQASDPGVLNGALQAIARDMGLTHFTGRIDKDHPDTRKAGSRGNYQRVHIGRAEKELLSKGEYSWVADIRVRLDIAVATSQNERELKEKLCSESPPLSLTYRFPDIVSGERNG